MVDSIPVPSVQLFLDLTKLAPRMKGSELRACYALAAAGKELSIMELMKAMKMARSGVVIALDLAMARGIVTRYKDGREYVYELSEAGIAQAIVDITVLESNSSPTVLKTDSSAKQAYTSVDATVLETDTLGGTIGGDAVSRKAVKPEDVSRKDLRRNDVKDLKTYDVSECAVVDSTLTSDATNTPTPQQELFQEVCDSLGWDAQLLTKDQRGQVASLMGRLGSASPPYGIDDVRAAQTAWLTDWRWTKNKSYPTPAQFTVTLGQVRKRARASPVVESYTPEQVAAYRQQLRVLNGRDQ